MSSLFARVVSFYSRNLTLATEAQFPLSDWWFSLSWTFNYSICTLSIVSIFAWRLFPWGHAILLRLYHGLLTHDRSIVFIDVSGDFFSFFQLLDNPVKCLSRLAHVLEQCLLHRDVVFVQVLFDLLRATSTFYKDRLVFEVSVYSIWTNQKQVISDVDDWNGKIVLLQNNTDGLVKLISFPCFKRNWRSGE